MTTDEQPRNRAVKMPARWEEMGLGDFRGTIRFTRSFGRPPQIGPDERAWLIVEKPGADCVISLNGSELKCRSDGGDMVEVEVTDRLLERNELQLAMKSQDRGRPWEETALEFRGKAWLKQLVARRFDERLELKGVVMGQADEGLDLYTILGRKTAIYARVTPRPEGTAFCLASEPIAGGDWLGEVRVELVCGSSVWHSEIVPLSNV